MPHNGVLIDFDLVKAKEEYRDCLEAHAKAKARLKRAEGRVEDCLLAVLHAHENSVLSDPDLLTRLGTELVKRGVQKGKVEAAKELLKAASERYGIVLQDEEADL